MGFTDVFKILFLPALIAIALYASISYIILPLIKRHRERYSQYLPLGAISQHTNGIRDRVGDWITRLVVPRRQRVEGMDVLGEGEQEGRASDFTFEDGERMVGFDVEGGRGNGREGRG